MQCQVQERVRQGFTSTVTISIGQADRRLRPDLLYPLIVHQTPYMVHISKIIFYEKSIKYPFFIILTSDMDSTGPN